VIIVRSPWRIFVGRGYGAAGASASPKLLDRIAALDPARGRVAAIQMQLGAMTGPFEAR